MLGSVGNSSHILGLDNAEAQITYCSWRVGLRVSAMLWRLLPAVEFLFLCVLAQKRRCVFQVSPQNQNYTAAGNVNGEVQVCENTHCCVGYFWMVDGQPVIDVLACDLVEKSCPDSTCKAQPRFNNFSKCVCNRDFCNSNISWSSETQKPVAVTFSVSPADGKMRTAVKLVVAFLLVVFLIFAVNWKKEKILEKNLESSHHDHSSLPLPLCSCHMIKAADIPSAHIQLQQIVSQGHFATVYQGKYKGSAVAVKVFPAGWKQRFTAEKEVYELPLMRHAGIVDFLGTGRKPEDDGCFIVLQFAEYGSLHSFLWNHTISWRLALQMCHSLSQGLSFLHSEILHQGVHKPAVTHRDLSSSNVLVRADGTCALCDFGGSTILRSCSGRYSMSTVGPTQLGTLCYMSPELLEGSVNLSSSSFLLQGDVYALGLLLWDIWMRCSDFFEGGSVPQHLLPYELELGADAKLETLIVHVCYLERRPSVPEHWELLPQGPALKELLTDCWDPEPDARLSAQRVVDRLFSLQTSCTS